MEQENPDVVVELKTKTRGVLDPQIVRWIAFVVITVSLVACTVYAFSPYGSSPSPMRSGAR